MPKLKTHRGAAKRFKRTKNGKFLRGSAFKQHILSSKTTKRKRGLRGTYIAVDAFHLHRYVDEQVFRYNERRDPDGDSGRFVKALRSIVGKRLTYRDLTTDPGLATTPA